MNPISPQRRRVRQGALGIQKRLGALCASAVILFACNFAMAQRLHEVPLTDVKLQGEFWGPKLETNRTVTIPHCFKECEQTGRIANFERAAHGERGEAKGFVFNDSDVYKTTE